MTPHGPGAGRGARGNVGPHEGGAQQADEADGRLRRPQLIGDALDSRSAQPICRKVNHERHWVAGPITAVL